MNTQDIQVELNKYTVVVVPDVMHSVMRFVTSQVSDRVRGNIWDLSTNLHFQDLKGWEVGKRMEHYDYNIN